MLIFYYYSQKKDNRVSLSTRSAGGKMKIYIMRHGDAANIAGKDSLRPLTQQGLFETERMGFWLAQNKPQLTNVFVSPYLRAQQTCENVTEALTKSGLLNNLIPETLDLITPSGNARQVHDFIDGLFQLKKPSSENCDFSDNQAILFISHMPFVSYLVAELTTSFNTPIFSTGAVAVIDYDVKQMKGQLVDIVVPAKV